MSDNPHGVILTFDAILWASVMSQKLMESDAATP
jgi:hypothetical protein